MSATARLPSARRRLPPRLSALRRVRRAAVLTLLICLIPIGISYGTTISRPSNSSFMINSVEWLRDHGAAGVASTLESFYYSWSAPATGGPALHRLAIRLRAISAVHPADLAALIHPALRAEGVWTPTETWSGTNSPIQVTQFRSDPLYPQMVAGVAWIDPHRTSIALYPGRQEPSVTIPRGLMEAPPSLRGRLLATFNSGFKLQDSHGGFALGGVTYAPLHDGMATIVRYRDGRMDIVDWQGGSSAGAGVDYARQNLPLIVSGAQPNPNLSGGPEWGATLGNAVRVWRSGIGIDARGDLIYAAAADQTVGSLAQVLIHAGAIRAMQLDINDYWTSFNSYAAPQAGQPSKLLPAMVRPADRYLSADDRDFFAVYLR
ncbi:MAG: hypothetical protein M3Y09_09805 [Actinomycetota bacterium]|nr:hypothetical protein [Actinomycetota bacterium]